MQTTQVVYQSRYGYHSTDRNTYLGLKYLSKWAHWNFRALRRRDKYLAKMPHNRVQRTYSRNELGQRTGVLSTTPLPEPKVMSFMTPAIMASIVTARFAAKHVYDKADDVPANCVHLEFLRNQPGGIAGLIAQVETWVKENR